MAKHSEKGLQVMDHSGPIYGTLVFHHSNHLKGIMDGPVWVWPAGGAVLFHLKNKIILKEKILDVNPSLRPRTEYDAPECTYVFLYIVLQILAYFCGLQYVIVDHQHVLTGQTDAIFTLLRDGEQVVANFLTFLRPRGTKPHLFFCLTTNQQDRKL